MNIVIKLAVASLILKPIKSNFHVLLRTGTEPKMIFVFLGKGASNSMSLEV